MNYETMEPHELNRLALQRLGYRWEQNHGFLPTGRLIMGYVSRWFPSEAEAWRVRQPATVANDTLWLLEGYFWTMEHYSDGGYTVSFFNSDEDVHFGEADTFQLAGTIAFLRATEPAAVTP